MLNSPLFRLVEELDRLMYPSPLASQPGGDPTGPKRPNDRNAIERIYTVGEGRVLAPDAPNARPLRRTGPQRSARNRRTCIAFHGRSRAQFAAGNSRAGGRRAQSPSARTLRRLRRLGSDETDPPATEPETAEAQRLRSANSQARTPKSLDVPFGGGESGETNEGPVVDGEPAIRDVRGRPACRSSSAKRPCWVWRRRRSDQHWSCSSFAGTTTELPRGDSAQLPRRLTATDRRLEDALMDALREPQREPEDQDSTSSASSEQNDAQ